jgi:hypothetical protein
MTAREDRIIAWCDSMEDAELIARAVCELED